MGAPTSQPQPTPAADPVRYAVNSQHVRWRVVDGEAVLIHVDTTFYYSLNATGTFLWQLLVEEERSFEEMVRALAAHSRRSPEAVRPDVAAFLDQMKEEELVV